MKPIVLNTHKFSHGVLQVDFSLIFPFYQCINIDKVVFSEFEEGQYGPALTAEVDVIREKSSYDASTDKQKSAKYIVQLSPNENHLVKATVYIDPTNAIGIDLPCCMKQEQIDGVTYWLYEEFFVDLTAYEMALVSSISLKCNNCEVPIGNVNGLLKLFAVMAAVESHDPKMEYIYSKITCGKRINASPQRLTTKCNCNG